MYNPIGGYGHEQETEENADQDYHFSCYGEYIEFYTGNRNCTISALSVGIFEYPNCFNV